MTSKSSNQTSSRRYPLKRVRANYENQGSISSINGQTFKKICRQPSQDLPLVEIEKSSDERAYDLFQKEYFAQIRPYFKHRSIAQQLLEHLWNNMIESSKVAFVKKILKEQKFTEISSTNFNDENDCQLEKSFNQSNENLLIRNRYNRGFINEFLAFLKQSISPRFVDMMSSKVTPPLRRSSRIRRAPNKCLCSSCSTNGINHEHSFSNDQLENETFIHLINHYHQLDDQYVEQFNQLNDNQIIESPLVENIVTEVQAQPNLSEAINNNHDASIDLSINKDEKLSTAVLSDSLEINQFPIRHTYVILTELDEPFFGPYPIEFTITI